MLRSRHSLFSYIKIGKSVLFYKGIKSITKCTLIESLIAERKKCDISELIFEISENYGIIINRSDITQIILDSDMYFDRVSAVLYEKYQEFTNDTFEI